MVPNFRIFILHLTWHIDKFQSAGFKYGNSFSNVQPRNTQLRRFSPKFQNVLFLQKPFRSGKFESSEILI